MTGHVTFSLNHRQGVAIAAFRGNQLAKRDRAELKKAFSKAVDLRFPVVLDFGPMESLDSKGLSLVVAWIEESRRLGGTLVLCSESVRLRALLELVRLPAYVPVAGSLAEAVERCLDATRASHGAQDATPPLSKRAAAVGA